MKAYPIETIVRHIVTGELLRIIGRPLRDTVMCERVGPWPSYLNTVSTADDRLVADDGETSAAAALP